MSGRGLANQLVEQAFAGWLLRDFDLETVERVARFLRPEDFSSPVYAHVYEAALEVVRDYRRPPSKLSVRKARSATRKAGPPVSDAATEAGSADKASTDKASTDKASSDKASSDEASTAPATKPRPTADDLYARLRKGNRWHKPVTPDQLLDIEIQCPKVVAPRDWARLLVEDGARRRITQLSYVVEAAPQARDAAEMLEQARNHLQATLQQLQLAESRVNGAEFSLRVLDPTFDWRDTLRPVELAVRPGPSVPLTEEEVLDAENTLLALCLQHPDVGKNVVVRGEVMPDDLRGPMHKGVYECMKNLVHRDVPLNSVSVFRELLAKAGEKQDADDQLSMARSLAVYERLAIGSPHEARMKVLAYVTRTSNEAAVRDMRALPPRVDMDTVVVTDLSLRRVTRATYAAAGMNVARNDGRLSLPPAPARRPENRGPASSAGR